LILNFAVEYAIRRVEVNQEGLKLNDTHLLLVYADDVNIIGESVPTIKNKEALLVRNKEIGLEVNADKTEYVVTCRDQNAGPSHNIKIDNSSFERFEEFKYLETTLTYQILFRTKLRADWSQGMFAIIRCRIFCLPGCYPKD